MASSPRDLGTPSKVETTYEGWQLAMQIQIRDEIRGLHSLIACHNTQQIPRTLRAIHRELVRIRKVLEAPEEN